jgi:hypothetical protein
VIQKLGVAEMTNEVGETFKAFNTSQAWFYNNDQGKERNIESFSCLKCSTLYQK